jgi:hypothetical protein
MTNPQTQIHTLVNDFVASLHQVWNQSVADALAGIGPGTNGGASRKAASPKAVRSDGRAKGEKRTPDEIAALKETFVAFVAKNPGLRIEQIHKQLGTNTKDLQLPIRQLIAEGRVKSVGEKRSTTYKAGK